MPAQTKTDRVVLGDHVFDLETGELTSLTLRDGATPSRRLAPQPAKLLGLLIAKQGALLSRAEIQKALWADVAVDVDQSLSFCVRQVRAALGDSADAPRYLETLPRRGYRLLVDAVPASHEPASDEPGPSPLATDGAVAPLPSPSPPSPPSPVASRRRRLVAIVVLAIAAVLGFSWVANQPGASSNQPRRLAIMPFSPPPSLEVPGDPAQVGWTLVAALGGENLDQLVVVGPTTTRAYSSDLRSVARLVEELEVDFAMNGRFFQSEDGLALLAELIRAKDGAHVWVKAYPVSGADWSGAAVEIEQAIRTHVLASAE